MDTFTNIIGWLGAFGLLFAFYLNTSGKLNSKSLKYNYLNMFCAILLAVNAYLISSYPFLVVNVFWTLVSLWALVRIYKTKD
ncbi:MAG: hypothetical protein V3V14_11790 [Saprospiraceae bacterium]